LEKFGIKHLQNNYPLKLSQGEKQRVAVARAFVNDAELIIADEPTGSLNSDQGMTVIRYLRESADIDNRCVVIASHDERIAHYADRVFYLSDGKLVRKQIP
jgi:putative ABC transport system ATP-binding protein